MRTKRLNVLVACESNATVRDAFRALGHNAWSCDLLPCDGDPRYHVQGDVLPWLSGVPRRWRFGTMLPSSTPWDLLIGHPPCTYLCNSGVRWLVRRCRPAMRMECDETRWKQMEAAAKFFNLLWNFYPNHGPYVAIENPIMHKYGRHACGAGRPDQIIQPWQFGHGETKATCLWLRNLPKLVPTNIVAGREHRIHRMSPRPNRWKERSKTFVGIAQAMAQQWSAHIINELESKRRTIG